MRLFERKIRKSNQLIRAEEAPLAETGRLAMVGGALKAKLAGQARRIFNSLVAVLNETGNATVEVNLNDIEEITHSELHTKDYDACMMAIGSLAYQIKTDNSFEHVQMFHRIKYTYGSRLVEAQFTDNGAKFITEVVPFTRYYLSDYLALTGLYAQSLFEFLKSWEGKKEVKIGIAELQKILHFPDTYLKNVGQIKRKVLNVAQSEMKKKIGYEFTYRFNATYKPNSIIFTIGKIENTPKVFKPKQAAYLCAKNHVNKNIKCEIYFLKNDCYYGYKNYQEERRCIQCRICKYIDVLRQKKQAKQTEQLKKDGLFD